MSRDTSLLWLPPGFKATEKQRQFFLSEAFECLYGGSAGGGKTIALIIGALEFVDHAMHSALLLRRTYVQAQQNMETAMSLYAGLGGEWRASQRTFRFPSGATVRFGSMEQEQNKYDYQGSAYNYIGFDELGQFSESQYGYLTSRLRSAAGLPSRLRATSNPGTEWVFTRFRPWVDPTRPDHLESGLVRHCTVEEGQEVFKETETNETLSRSFVRAQLEDNPHLAENDPTYRKRLMAMDYVNRQQLLFGDWLTVAAAGLYFKRQWFPVVDAAPIGASVRAWDIASTVGKHSDWTVGVKIVRAPDGRFVVADVLRLRGTPVDVERAICATATQDGRTCTIVLPEDPGAAGKFVSDLMIRKLAGFNVHALKISHDKLTYARPVSAQVEAGNISVNRGIWNGPFFLELEQFPDENCHDDQVDALSLGFRALCEHQEWFFSEEWDRPMKQGIRPFTPHLQSGMGTGARTAEEEWEN